MDGDRGILCRDERQENPALRSPPGEAARQNNKPKK
jgi:hypothetical protein